jgi:hypothetical protein
MADLRLVSVAKSLGMSQTPETMEALRRDIRTEFGGLHPDKNGGTGTTALVPVETVAPMVAAILEALNSKGQLDAHMPSAVARGDAIRAEAKEEAAYRFRLSRYT